MEFVIVILLFVYLFAASRLVRACLSMASSSPAMKLVLSKSMFVE